MAPACLLGAILGPTGGHLGPTCGHLGSLLLHDAPLSQAQMFHSCAFKPTQWNTEVVRVTLLLPCQTKQATLSNYSGQRDRKAQID